MTFSYFEVALKLTLGLISLILVINLSGKSNLAPNSASDQVQNYVLGGIIGGVIYSSSISILQYFIILLMWTILVLTLKWLKTHNRLIKRVIDGRPTVLINKGKLDVDACRSVGLSAGDIAFKLRSQGIYQIRSVKRAVLEQNGQLIIVKKGEENPKYPIITDGVIQHDILDLIDKDETWLIEQLHQQGIDEISNVFIAEYDSGNITVFCY